MCPVAYVVASSNEILQFRNDFFLDPTDKHEISDKTEIKSDIPKRLGMILLETISNPSYITLLYTKTKK